MTIRAIVKQLKEAAEELEAKNKLLTELWEFLDTFKVVDSIRNQRTRDFTVRFEVTGQFPQSTFDALKARLEEI